MQKFRCFQLVASNFKAIRSFTQICSVVMCHQYGISALVPLMPFCGGEEKKIDPPFWTGSKMVYYQVARKSSRPKCLVKSPEMLS